MDLSGRPLLDTKPDHELFAGRDAELARLIESVERGLNVLLVGERGSGKTTILRQLAFTLRNRSPEQPPAFVEGRLAESPRLFLELVRNRLGLPPAIGGTSPATAAVELFRSKPPIRDTLELPSLVATLHEAVTSGRREVLVDEMSVDRVGSTLFGRLRDELWQVPLTWVVAVNEEDSGPLQAPPADAFFDAVVRLNPLTRDAQRELLEARTGANGIALSSQLDEGNPRRLLTLARETLDSGVGAAQRQAALSHRWERVGRLGRPASMLMAELESLGPSSASDERLLERLGWTRTRAVQVFRELEEAGLVTSSYIKGETGRKRKVYRPRDLQDPEHGEEEAQSE